MKRLLLLAELTSKDVDQSEVEERQTGKRKEKSEQEIDYSLVDDEVESVCSHGAVDEPWFYSRQAVVRLVLDVVLEERRNVVDDRQHKHHRQYLFVK